MLDVGRFVRDLQVAYSCPRTSVQTNMHLVGGDRYQGLWRGEHAGFSANAQAERSRLRCSLPHVQRTSNTGTNVIP
jgi:hypothetical protein